MRVLRLLRLLLWLLLMQLTSGPDYDLSLCIRFVRIDMCPVNWNMRITSWVIFSRAMLCIARTMSRSQDVRLFVCLSVRYLPVYCQNG